MPNILGMTIEELKLFAEEAGEKPFRGKQLFVWLNRGVRNIDEMTDLPKAFREKLKGILEEGSYRISTKTEIPCVFHPRWGARWDALSALPLWGAS